MYTTNHNKRRCAFLLKFSTSPSVAHLDWRMASEQSLHLPFIFIVSLVSAISSGAEETHCQSLSHCHQQNYNANLILDTIDKAKTSLPNQNHTSLSLSRSLSRNLHSDGTSFYSAAANDGNCGDVAKCCDPERSTRTANCGYANSLART